MHRRDGWNVQRMHHPRSEAGLAWFPGATDLGPKDPARLTSVEPRALLLDPS
jgi:hypothetical protein